MLSILRKVQKWPRGVSLVMRRLLCAAAQRGTPNTGNKKAIAEGQ